MRRRRSSAYRISIMSLLVALIILQSALPMVGYISLGGISITTLHLTVIVGAVVLGTSYGTALGAVWGLSSWIMAFVRPSDVLTILLFRNPIIAFLPRILAGLVAGVLFNQLLPRVRTGVGGSIKMAIAGIGAALTNTLLVVALTWVFYASKAAALIGHGANTSNFGWVMLALLGVNAIAEVIMAGVITPILGQALIRFRRR
ncbi:ECF transporter S component [Lacticaseibacillus thailandensis]|uniref:Membrane protein n=1 Tax=Lacticaseibacillus thailandensis DSM 22698 = JCM 13996 TaxID=1423810 RepID=A0A0R2C9R7_9LACO|nr:ECF transporter S component [Lacticaseibacillus thailandensis]KRM87826.1 membrane protein [Lacticaseibacillus thailandensis DSM 22698 = JCM 13996]